MPVLLIAAFFVTAAATLAALGTRFDFTQPIEIAVDPITQSARAASRPIPTVASS
jgi:hypothetical protein